MIDVLVDFAFMTDVGINFRTTALDADTKETITDTREIAARQVSERLIVVAYDNELDRYGMLYPPVAYRNGV